LNPAPYRPCESVLNLCDWVFPNEVECEQLTGIKPISDSDARRAAARLRFMAPEAQVALTLGARGAWLDTGAFVGLIAGFSVAVVDTVGAGDTWTAAFVTRLIEGVGPKGAARFANAAAAIAVTREGAQSSIPTREEVEQFLADGG
jgi:ribokinase